MKSATLTLSHRPRHFNPTLTLVVTILLLGSPTGAEEVAEHSSPPGPELGRTAHEERIRAFELEDD